MNISSIHNNFRTSKLTARYFILLLLVVVTLNGCSNLSVALGPRVTNKDLQKIKKVAVMLESKSSGSPAGFGFTTVPSSTGGAAFNDTFSIELLKLGFEVVERQQLDKVTHEQTMNLSGITEADKTIAVGKVLALDAVITGTVELTTLYSNGVIFGVGAGVRDVVKNATVKIIDVETGRWLLAMSLAADNKSGLDAAKELAKALQEQLQK